MAIDWVKARANPMSSEAPSFSRYTSIELARRVASTLPIWDISEDVDLTVIRVGESDCVLVNETRRGTVLTYVDFTARAEVVFTVNNPVYVAHLLNRVYIEVEQVVLDKAFPVDERDLVPLSPGSLKALDAVNVLASTTHDSVLTEQAQIVRKLVHDSRGGITREADARICALFIQLASPSPLVQPRLSSLEDALDGCIRLAEADDFETSDVLLIALVAAIRAGELSLTSPGVSRIRNAVGSIRTAISERHLDATDPQRTIES